MNLKLHGLYSCVSCTIIDTSRGVAVLAPGPRVWPSKAGSKPAPLPGRVSTGSPGLGLLEGSTGSRPSTVQAPNNIVQASAQYAPAFDLVSCVSIMNRLAIFITKNPLLF